MIPVPSGVRVWIATGHTDMRRGMQGLALQVQESLKRNKSDLPHARRTQQQMEAMLGLRAPTDWTVPVLATNGIDRTGLPELADAVQRKADLRNPGGSRHDLSGRTRRVLAQSLARLVEKRVMSDRSPAVAAIITSLQTGETSLQNACGQIFELLREHSRT